MNAKIIKVKQSWFVDLKANPTALMVLAGFLYSSWPLGYWLNPQADHGLASNLEALHQPFNWLFILMDIASGLLVAMVCLKLLATSKSGFNLKTHMGLRISILGAAGFGIFTAIDAILPLDCIEGTPQCVVTLNDSYFVIHGIFSIGSIAGLTISIVGIWLLLLFGEARARALVHLTPAMFLVVWLGFGVLTLYLVFHNQSSALSQHLFIGFCCLWLVVLPYFVRLVARPLFPGISAD